MDIDSLYDTIAKQQTILNSRDRDWRPTVMPLSNNQTPVMPMQITGSLVYDNTPNMYVAPAYGEFKDLSIKKDTEARLNKSAWEKVKDNLYNLAPDINDPSFIYVKELMGKAVDDFDNKLKNGIWSEQADISRKFAKELMDKKGGKQFMNMKATMEQNRQDVSDAVDSYDPDKATDGIRQDEVNFYQTPKVKPFVFDEQGNIIGGGQLEYPKIFKNRNLPKEIDDIAKNTEFFKDVGNNKGLLVQTDLFAKYGVLKNEYVTPERIKEIAQSYLLNTGGYEYLRRQGEIKQFNNPLSIDEAREKLKELSNLKEEKDKDNPYLVLLNSPNSELQQRLNNGLGATLQTADLTSSLLSGAITKNAYSKRDIDFINDEVAQHAQNAYVDSLYKKSGKDGNGDEEGSQKIDYVPYSFLARSIGTYETFDPTSAVSIQNRKIAIGNETNALTSSIEQFKKGKVGFENDPNYKGLLQRKADLDAELKLLDNENKQNIKYFGNLIKEATNNGKASVPLYSAYNDYIGQAKFQNGNAKPVSRETWENAIASAILAEADNDPRTNASQILNKAGIGTVIDYTNNKYFNDVKKSNFRASEKVEVQGGSSMGQYMPSVRYFNQGDILSVISRSANLLKKKTKDSGGLNNSQTIMKDTTVFTLEGETAKYPEAERFVNAQKQIKGVLTDNMGTLKVFNPSGNPKNDKTLASAMAEELGIDTKDINKMFVIDNAYLSTTQSFGKEKGSVYVASFKLKDVKEKEDPDIYKAQQKLREKLQEEGNYSIRFTLGANQRTVDNEMQVALKGLLYANKGKILGMTDNGKERAALALGNMNGVNEGIDMLHVYELDGTGRGDKNQYRDLSFSGYNIRITARDIPFAQNKYDKDFNVQVKEDGVFKTLAFKDGKPGLFTDAELKSDKSITTKNFDTDLDIKAYLNLLRLESESANFNTGGGGYSNTPEAVKGYINKVRSAESGGNDRAKSPTSSATGRYQFTQSTWKNVEKALNKDLDKYNPNHQEVAMEWLTTQNSNYLKQKGIPLTNGNLYMVHFLGQGGANRFFKVLKENPNAPATSFATREEYEANKEIFNRVKTVQDLYNFMTKKVS